MKKTIIFLMVAVLLASLMVLGVSANLTTYGSDVADLTDDFGALYFGEYDASVAIDYTPKGFLRKAKCQSYVFPTDFEETGADGGYIELYMTDGEDSDSDYVIDSFDSNFTNVKATVKTSNNALEIVSRGFVSGPDGLTADLYEMTITHGDVF